MNANEIRQAANAPLSVLENETQNTTSVSSSSPELFPDESDPIQRITLIEHKLAEERRNVDQIIVQLFNAYKSYSETMVSLINAVNTKKQI